MYVAISEWREWGFVDVYLIRENMVVWFGFLTLFSYLLCCLVSYLEYTVRACIYNMYVGVYVSL